MKLISSLPNWLRWILLLPISIIGYITTFILIDILNKICINYIPSISEPVCTGFFQLISGIIASFCFIWLAGTLAPNNKRKVAVTLAMLILLLNVYLFIILQMHNDFNFYQKLISFISRAAAIIVAINTARCFKTDKIKVKPSPIITNNFFRV